MKSSQTLLQSESDIKFDRFNDQLTQLDFQLKEDIRQKVSLKEYMILQEQINKKTDGNFIRNLIKESKNENETKIQQQDDAIEQIKKQLDDFINGYFQKQLKQNQNQKKQFQERFNDFNLELEKLNSLKEKEQLEIINNMKQYKCKLNKDYQKQFENIQQSLDKMNQNILDQECTKQDKKQYIDKIKEIEKIIHSKTNYKDVQQNVNLIQNQFNQNMQEFRNEIQNKLLDNNDQQQQNIKKRALISEVNKQLQNIITIDKVEYLIKQNLGSLDQQNIKRLIDKVYNMSDEKLDKKHYEGQMDQLKSLIKQLESQLQKKIEMDQVCTILDNKANIDDINKVFQEFHQELVQKITTKDFKNFKQKQLLINESLCQENVVGRWIWRQGELKSGYKIVWDNQIINTMPDNFIFEKGKRNILIMNAGFYSQKKPTIQLQINDETILSAVNDNNNAIYHSNQKIREQQLSQKNITGLTMIDFVKLPSKSKLSLIYSGDNNVEGFFSIKKL